MEINIPAEVILEQISAGYYSKEEVDAKLDELRKEMLELITSVSISFKTKGATRKQKVEKEAVVNAPETVANTFMAPPTPVVAEVVPSPPVIMPAPPMPPVSFNGPSAVVNRPSGAHSASKTLQKARNDYEYIDFRPIGMG